MMPPSVDFLFDRLGRYLEPTVTKTSVVYQTGRGSTEKEKEKKQRSLPIRQGVCQRTGIAGDVIPYEEKASSEPVVIPTLAKLAWVFAGQMFAQSSSPMRLTAGRVIAVTRHKTYSTIGFAKTVPNLEVVDIATLLRGIVGEKCLFLAFSNKPSSVLGNSLRWTLGDHLEVNGILNLMPLVVDNAAINLRSAADIAELLPPKADKQKLQRIFWSLSLDERSESENQLLQALIKNVGVGRPAVPLSLPALQALQNASREEFVLAMKMRQI